MARQSLSNSPPQDPTLVRRLVLVGRPLLDRMPVVRQETLVLRIEPGADDASWAKGVLPNARFVEFADYAADLFEAAPKTLAKQINAFLKGEGPPRAAQ